MLLEELISQNYLTVSLTNDGLFSLNMKKVNKRAELYQLRELFIDKASKVKRLSRTLVRRDR